MTHDDSPRAASASDLSARPASVDAGGEPALVRFVQIAGDTWHEWTVVEVDARNVPGTRGEHCLVFSRRDCIRRVWTYPLDWRTLDDAALAVLSWAR